MRKSVREDIEYVKKRIKGTSFSVIIEKSKTKKYGIKLRPWCKIYPKDGELNNIRTKLFQHNVGNIEQHGFIIIKNISPCLLALKFLDEPVWWRKVLYMMEDGLHNTKKGIISITKERNKQSKWEGKNLKWTVDKVIDTISKNS